ncbi:Proteasome subunit alpha type-2 [Nowakowskiella sp. JEL0078]|nr:Proteasome subunit alpha type-2 [Nowakowskiella sp. JEL0078]
MELVRDVVKTMEEGMMESFDDEASKPVSSAFSAPIPLQSNSSENSQNDDNNNNAVGRKGKERADSYPINEFDFAIDESPIGSFLLDDSQGSLYSPRRQTNHNDTHYYTSSTSGSVLQNSESVVRSPKKKNSNGTSINVNLGPIHLDPSSPLHFSAALVQDPLDPSPLVHLLPSIRRNSASKKSPLSSQPSLPQQLHILENLEETGLEEQWPIMETMSQDAIEEMVERTFLAAGITSEDGEEGIGFEDFKRVVELDSNLLAWFEALGMKMGDRYSFSLTTFSPSGKLGQIEYALTAVSQGITSIGIKGIILLAGADVFSDLSLIVPFYLATNGIVIATEKKQTSTLVDDTSIEKVSMISKNIGIVYSGMGPDARVLVDRARKSAQSYKQVYSEEPPTSILVKEIASVMQDFTQSGGVRPFGVSLLVAGYDDLGPQLYQVDPSGSYFSWKATAIGKNMINAKTFLEKRYTPQMELEDAVHTAILTLKEGFEGALTESTVEIGIATFEPKFNTLGEKIEGEGVPTFRRLTEVEIKDYLANIA